MSQENAVLIVEDDWLLVAQLETWLEEEGVAMSGAASSIPDALALLDGGSPAFALVDLNLNGVAATPLIDELNRRGVRVIVTTGYSRMEGREAVCDMIEKPYGKDELIQALRRAGLQDASSAGRRSR